MRTKALILVGVAAVGYVLGTRATRPVAQRRESVRHQIERMWTDPKARKRRERRAKELKRHAEHRAKALRKDAERSAKRVAKAARKRAKDLGR